MDIVGEEEPKAVPVSVLMEMWVKMDAKESPMKINIAMFHHVVRIINPFLVLFIQINIGKPKFQFGILHPCSICPTRTVQKYFLFCLCKYIN